MAIGDAYEVRVVGSLHLQTTVNTFVYEEIVADTGPTPALSLAAAFDSDVMSFWLPAVSDQWVHTLTSAQRYKPAPRLEAAAIVHVEAGTKIGESLPSHSCAVLSKRSGIARRADRGRCYIAGVREADHQGSFLAGTGLTDFALLAGRLDNNLVGGAPSTGTWRPAIQSSRLNKIDRDVRVPITLVIARSLLGVQRRRTPGRGL